jgi:hypothetical protein
MAYTWTDEQAEILATEPTNQAKRILRGLFEAMDLDCWVSSKTTLEKFQAAPVCSSKLGTACTGGDGDENVWLIERNAFECHVITGQTLLAPIQLATGLNVAMDQAASDGLEITQGILSNSRMAFTIGTHAFYGSCKWIMSDVSDLGDCAFGFRKAEAYQADIDNYDDMACFNIQAGQVEIHTIINDNTTVETDTEETDWADGAAHTVEVHVDIDGVVTFLYDGATPETTKTFTFDDGDVVIPFFYFKLGGDGDSTVVLQEWDVREVEEE